ncbi:MAG: glycosyltransferase family 2 protein [Calothrix sp. MO_167.B42]|nr:glycosyltransferase family 2 protein [Calothrix sp. MO_167.B42]
MYQPLVTIGICTFNRFESLCKYSLPAIEQLIYSNYEVIIVDDCSTDKTQQILGEYQHKINQLSVLRNEKNRGLPYSRNKILENAKGKIIVFTDDDVSIFPDCLNEIVKVYEQDSEVLFIWGGVYQCHGSWDRDQLTFGSGSLFSIRRIVAEHFRFDTNIRYFNTYGCEEHDFARRVQREQAKIVKIAAVKANHYQAPAKDRAWRGLGGNLNYLYEKVKRGSIFEYYKSILIGLPYAIQRLVLNYPTQGKSDKNAYQEAVNSFHQVLILLKNRKFLLASKYLFYVMADIPIKAMIRKRIEAKQIHGFSEYLHKC